LSYQSWQAQIRGSKKWSLEPPPECYYQCQPIEVVVHPGDTSMSPASLLNYSISYSSLNLFPYFVYAVVLDTNIWYHKTTVVSDEISIVIGSEFD